MKLLSRIVSFASFLIGTLIYMSSCSYEDIAGDQPFPLPSGGEMAEISLIADMPAATVVTTRSTLGSVPENTIGDICILVFEKTGSQRLIYKGNGKSLTVIPDSDNNNKVTFKATLPVGTKYDFMLLANVADKLSGISVSASPASTKADVLKLVETLAAGTKWNTASKTIPMWGEKELTLTASSSPAFTLTRMLARVNVKYDPVEVSGVAPNNFKLTSVRVYNYNTAGALVPAATNVNESNVATAATIPASPGTQTGSALVYSGTDIINDNECKDKIYLFEAAHNGKTYTSPADNSEWINNPCLVIGGKYSPDGTNWSAEDTYYRVDFIKKTTTGSVTTDEWLSILRNFSYNVVITEVSGEGYLDPGVALRSAPFNMEANVLNWEERDMGEIVFDGMFYLSVSRDEFVLQRHNLTGELEDQSNVLYVKTDFQVEKNPAHEDSGWYVEKYEDLMGNPVTWLTLNPGKRPSGWRPNDKNKAYFTAEPNNGTGNREANVWIRAGRLRYKIHVVQRILSLDITDPDNGNAPIEEMLFEVPRTGSRVHPPRHFDVTWYPIGQSVTTSNESTADWNPFEPGWITPGTLPAPNATGTIPGGSGTQSYTVQAPEVPGEEIDRDPFYEKESTYWFEVNNGGDTEKKGIRLHQIYYNIVVDAYKYRLDGGTHTVTVRSNTEWEISNVEEWLYNEDPNAPGASVNSTPIMLNLKAYDNLKVGTTGGPNVNGEAVAFTTVNNDGGPHDGKWGTVYVTFHSPTGKFPDHRVALPFPPASKLLMGLGYMDVYACNVGLPTPYHKNSAFQMLSSPYNFGSMEESIFKVDGFRIVGYNAQGQSNGNPNGLYPDYDWHPNSMRDWLNEDRPDVIVIGSYTTDTYGTRYNANELRLLKEYLDNGGAIILMANGLVTYEELLGQYLEVFLEKPNGSLSTSTGGTGTSANSTDVKTWISGPASGAYYLLEDVEDPVLNGPFGDVRGTYWGSHYHTGGIKTSLIEDQAITLSKGKEQSGSGTGRGHNDYTTIFRHRTKNLIWIGCDGFAASNMIEWQQGTYNGYGPVALEQRFYRPIARTNWKADTAAASVPTVSVNNSIVLANAVAWALTVTNHTPPAEGYKNQ